MGKNARNVTRNYARKYARKIFAKGNIGLRKSYASEVEGTT